MTSVASNAGLRILFGNQGKSSDDFESAVLSGVAGVALFGNQGKSSDDFESSDDCQCRPLPGNILDVAEQDAPTVVIRIHVFLNAIALPEIRERHLQTDIGQEPVSGRYNLLEGNSLASYTSMRNRA